jgi:hypothetical protein
MKHGICTIRPSYRPVCQRCQLFAWPDDRLSHLTAALAEMEANSDLFPEEWRQRLARDLRALKTRIAKRLGESAPRSDP